MTHRTWLIFLHVIIIWVVVTLAERESLSTICAETCRAAVHRVNESLTSRIDEKELVEILESLNSSQDSKLPPKYVTKQKASDLGWHPGTNLWAHPGLQGRSIGGDHFSNRERKLPDGGRIWREADLDYRGGHRGPKRLIFSNDGIRMVTVDHYRTYKEIPRCR